MTQNTKTFEDLTLSTATMSAPMAFFYALMTENDKNTRSPGLRIALARDEITDTHADYMDVFNYYISPPDFGNTAKKNTWTLAQSERAYHILQTRGCIDVLSAKNARGHTAFQRLHEDVIVKIFRKMLPAEKRLRYLVDAANPLLWVASAKCREVLELVKNPMQMNIVLSQHPALLEEMDTADIAKLKTFVDSYKNSTGKGKTLAKIDTLLTARETPALPAAARPKLESMLKI
ncbi:MAG: hypothetical protein LBU87_01400 [Lactobacillales bacterium]|jgi:hypothetical protein|nr:hypothetical protein [Lactobacillales bacterium]